MTTARHPGEAGPSQTNLATELTRMIERLRADAEDQSSAQRFWMLKIADQYESKLEILQKVTTS